MFVSITDPERTMTQPFLMSNSDKLKQEKSPPKNLRKTKNSDQKAH